MWDRVTDFGDSAVLLPLAALLFAGFWVAGARRMAGQWAGFFGSLGAAVAVSKLAYLHAGIGIAVIQFRGFSGHTAFAFAAYPAAFWLLVQPGTARARRCALALGLVLGALVGFSRLQVHAHTVSEVLGGAALGTAVALAFLRGRQPLQTVPSWMRWATMLLYLACFQLGRAPTQELLIALSGRWSDGLF